MLQSYDLYMRNNTYDDKTLSKSNETSAILKLKISQPVSGAIRRVFRVSRRLKSTKTLTAFGNSEKR